MKQGQGGPIAFLINKRENLKMRHRSKVQALPGLKKIDDNGLKSF